MEAHCSTKTFCSLCCAKWNTFFLRTMMSILIFKFESKFRNPPSHNCTNEFLAIAAYSLTKTISWFVSKLPSVSRPVTRSYFEYIRPHLGCVPPALPETPKTPLQSMSLSGPSVNPSPMGVGEGLSAAIEMTMIERPSMGSVPRNSLDVSK